MITTPSSFTHDYLSGLKFKELQKLSVKFNVSKRWIKKQELIENLLALKDKIKNENKQEDEKEWKDAGSFFNDLTSNNDQEVNRRLTFSITTRDNASGPQSGSQSSKDSSCKTISSRETYDIPQSEAHFSIEPLTESRATFDVPPKESLVSDVDPRATFEVPPKESLVGDVDSRATFDVPQNGKKFIDKSEVKASERKSNENKTELKNNKNSENKVSAVKEHIRKKSVEKSSKDVGNEKGKSQVKTLTCLPSGTVPHARMTRRTRKAGEGLKNEDSPIKMSRKSINIKKSTRVPVKKTGLIKSPAFSPVKKPINNQSIIQSLSKTQPRGRIQSKVPIRVHFADEKAQVNMEKEKALQVRLPQTEKKNPAKAQFGLPSARNSTLGTLNRTPLPKVSNVRSVFGRVNSSSTQTPGGGKPPSKLISATKMPDFSKIHKKLFEQMEPLEEYLKKKEERTRKLFGTPQPGQQLHAQKSAPVFRFQSGVSNKESNGKENQKVASTSLKERLDLKAARKETVKTRLPPSKLPTEIKNKNRIQIHGVRTNRRFELQMNVRNI